MILNGLVALALQPIAILGAGFAAQAEPLQATLGAWSIRTNVSGGLFRCISVRNATGRGQLVLGLNERHQMLVGVDHSPPPKLGHAPSVNLFVDGQPIDLSTLSARDGGDETLFFRGLYELKSGDGTSSLIESGQRFDYRYDNFAVGFDLTGLAEAIQYLRLCGANERQRDDDERVEQRE